MLTVSTFVRRESRRRSDLRNDFILRNLLASKVNIEPLTGFCLSKTFVRRVPPSTNMEPLTGFSISKNVPFAAFVLLQI